MLKKHFVCPEICKQFDSVSFYTWFSFSSDQHNYKNSVLDKISFRVEQICKEVFNNCNCR